MRRRRSLDACLALAAGVLAVTGCSSGGDAEADAGTRAAELGASAEEIEAREHSDAAEDDVTFVQGMVQHHEQALLMTSLVPDRAADDRIVLVAERMDTSQKEQIRQMQDWLVARGDIVADGHAHGGGLMPGMLTEAEMAELRAADGEEFDRLFLDGMIKHHLDVIQMVEDLLGSGGGGTDPEVVQLAQRIDADQRVEIDRMQQLLAGQG